MFKMRKQGNTSAKVCWKTFPILKVNIKLCLTIIKKNNDLDHDQIQNEDQSWKCHRAPSGLVHSHHAMQNLNLWSSWQVHSAIESFSPKKWQKNLFYKKVNGGLTWFKAKNRNPEALNLWWNKTSVSSINGMSQSWYSNFYIKLT